MATCLQRFSSLLFMFALLCSNVIAELQKFTLLPDTIIAVVGDTGAGKSSLLNALLDHFDILPTSGMQACTAAVVEINSNMKDDLYRAEIEFLSEKVKKYRSSFTSAG